MSPDLGALERLQSELGARRDQAGRPDLILDYGDPVGEQRALRQGAGIVWRSWRAAIRVGGQERASFLHRLLSGSVADVPVGGGSHVLLLDQKGKVQADLDLGVDPEQILLVGAATEAATTVATLERYVLRSPVSLRTADDNVVIGLCGPGWDNALGPLLGNAANPGLQRAEIADVPVEVLVRKREPGAREVIVQAAHAAEIWRALTEMGGDVVAAGWAASEVRRVELGIPSHGAELTGREFPQEARLDAAVDFEKGCYLGQETVARIRYRGHVNRFLCGLLLDAPVRAGEALRTQEAPAGQITSFVESHRHGPIALGYLQVDAAGAGTELCTATGTRAVVHELPFETPAC